MLTARATSTSVWNTLHTMKFGLTRRATRACSIYRMDEAQTLAGVAFVGLYYYGARYLDPKYSRWLSTDPALGDYIPQAPISDEARRNNSNLPGMGGVFNHINANLYHYGANNPVKYTDPTGKWTLSIGIGNGLAGKIKIGHNDGKWEFSWRIGFGVGGELSLDIADSTFTDGTRLGVYAEAEGCIEAGPYSLDASIQTGFESIVDSENKLTFDTPNNAEISASFNGEITASIGIDHGEIEILPASFNSGYSKDLSGGLGAMFFIGFGGEGVIKEDE